MGNGISDWGDQGSRGSDSLFPGKEAYLSGDQKLRVDD